MSGDSTSERAMRRAPLSFGRRGERAEGTDRAMARPIRGGVGLDEEAAADLIAQAEHDPLARAVCLTDAPGLAEAVAAVRLHESKIGTAAPIQGPT